MAPVAMVSYQVCRVVWTLAVVWSATLVRASTIEAALEATYGASGSYSCGFGTAAGANNLSRDLVFKKIASMCKGAKLLEEEAKLGADIKKSQREIESLIKGLEDVEDLLNEVKTKYCVSDFESIEYN